MLISKILNLKHSFGDTLLFGGISYSFSGKIFGISGANGSGKSTLLKLMAGLVLPEEGSVYFSTDSENVEKSDISNSCGLVSPHLNLYSEFSALENLSFLSKLKGLHKSSAMNSAKLLNTASYMHKPISKLSSGQYQRVKLAAAILSEPKILLLDEPFSNLDNEGVELVQNIINGYSNKDNMVIIASNNNAELESACDILHLECLNDQ